MSLRVRLLVALPLAAGCATLAASNVPTPKERVTECVDICTGVGLKMAALVVIANRSGCVCEPMDAKTSAKNGTAGAAAAGQAAVVAQEQEEQQAANQAAPSTFFR
jgi:hypothetical protein